MQQPLLYAQNITKKFGGITALEKVDLQLKAGQVTALIGENGAGKSTLLKIMSGIHRDYEGEIQFLSESVKFSSPKHAQEMGISIIHQELNLIPELTIAENVFLGVESTNALGFIDQGKMHQETTALLKKLHLEIPSNTPVKGLNVGQQQLVEIAKALRTDSKVLFMDEPTSALGEQEAEMLFKIIAQLKEEGRSVVYISHKLDELFQIADDYVVLRDGKMVSKGKMSQISRDEIVKLMSNREVQPTKIKKPSSSGEIRLTVKGLKVKARGKHIGSLDFQLRKGEVLGIYGLMGAGRTELLETLFGLHKETDGTIRLDGIEGGFRNPADAIQAGLALVPEDRKHDGFVSGMSVKQNATLTVLGKILQFGFLNNSKENDLVKKQIKSLGIKTSGPDQLIENLSGGNQQKVVLAKWIERTPKVLMLDEPTRGIDVGAKNEIYNLVRELTKTGLSVIVSSSEIPEIMALADRILVMSEGKLTAELLQEEATEEKIMNASIPHLTA